MPGYSEGGHFESIHHWRWDYCSSDFFALLSLSEVISSTWLFSSFASGVSRNLETLTINNCTGIYSWWGRGESTLESSAIQDSTFASSSSNTYWSIPTGKVNWLDVSTTFENHKSARRTVSVNAFTTGPRASCGRCEIAFGLSFMIYLSKIVLASFIRAWVVILRGMRFMTYPSVGSYARNELYFLLYLATSK